MVSVWCSLEAMKLALGFTAFFVLASPPAQANNCEPPQGQQTTDCPCSGYAGWADTSAAAGPIFCNDTPGGVFLLASGWENGLATFATNDDFGLCFTSTATVSGGVVLHSEADVEACRDDLDAMIAAEQLFCI